MDLPPALYHVCGDSQRLHCAVRPECHECVRHCQLYPEHAADNLQRGARILRGNVYRKKQEELSDRLHDYGTGRSHSAVSMGIFLKTGFFRTGNLWNDAAGRCGLRL